MTLMYEEKGIKLIDSLQISYHEKLMLEINPKKLVNTDNIGTY